MNAPLRLISSMATRQVLAEGVAAFTRGGGAEVRLEAVGGVDAARRVAEGEAFDVVALAADALQRLEAAGHLVAGSRRDLMRSGVAVAVRAGAPRPDLSDEATLRAAVLAAPTLGYSTGPSGTQLMRLFERWGVAEALHERIVQAPPGVPVAALVADGRVALGFQQLSELLHVPGIDIVGPLPPAVQITTVFGAAVAACSARREAAEALIAFLASEETAQAKRRQGMEPA